MGLEVGGIAGFFILVLDVWAILRVSQSSATTLAKTVWIVAILLLPLLGVIAWFFVGPKK